MMIKRAAAVTALAVLPLVTVSSAASAAQPCSVEPVASRLAAGPADLAASWSVAVPAELTSQGGIHAQTILSRLNTLRAEHGLQPVSRFVELDDVAQSRCERMAAAAAEPGTQKDDAGGDLSGRYPSGWLGSSTGSARVTTSESSADVGARLFEQWESSSQAYQHMLDPQANAVGIGLTYDPDSRSWYATQDLLTYPDASLADLTLVQQAPQDRAATSPGGPAGDSDAGSDPGGAGDGGDGDAGDKNNDDTDQDPDDPQEEPPTDPGEESPADPEEPGETDPGTSEPEPGTEDPEEPEDPESSAEPTGPSEGTEEPESEEEPSAGSASPQPSPAERSSRGSEGDTGRGGRAGGPSASASASGGARATSRGSSSSEDGGDGAGAAGDPTTGSGTVVAQSEETQLDEGLAITGASVAAALISQALVVIGLVVLMRRRRSL